MKLSELFNPNEFAARHLSFGDEAALLEALGEKSMDDFVGNTVPQSIRMPSELDLPEALTEADALAKLKGIASKNVINKSYIGLGYYPTRVPNVILRNVLENPGWYTAYTPYQPEISQGRLEALLNFQTMVQELTGLPIANASLLDEATAVAEAVGLMARTNKKGNRVILDRRLHPQVVAVTAERARTLGLEVEIADVSSGVVGESLIGVVLAYPGTEGDIVDVRGAIEDIHSRGGLAAIATDLLALQLLESPGTLGADIAVGSSQRFGVPLFFGGPHAAFMAVTEKLKRQLAGRIVGVSKDAEGHPPGPANPGAAYSPGAGHQ